MDIDHLARGIAAAVLTGVVRDKSRSAAGIAVAVAAASVVAVMAFDGNITRALFVLVAAAAFAIAAGTWLLRKLALKAISRIGEPQATENYQVAINRAIDDTDLPTGPLSALTFAWRLRRGPGAEADRLALIVSRLRSELGDGSGQT